ncbi:hypothetical protein NDU88_001917 [Pleurodeles waltl]|uniref:Uncharacterized protein n=1 Tax=Pleurodeles waltl TaxID=8319 RepID=A0AAV7V9S2_PLEWA|nr:hypothetical protein NDU88_001917 [Pleurodeles waltl]
MPRPERIVLSSSAPSGTELLISCCRLPILKDSENETKTAKIVSNDSMLLQGAACLLLQVQQEEAHSYDAQARADSAVIQHSLVEITNKKAMLATEMTELQQCVSDLVGTGVAAGKALDGHQHILSSLQLKVGDLENPQRRNNLEIFSIPEGKEDNDPRQYMVNNDRRCRVLRHLRSRSTILLHSRAPENTTVGRTRYRFSMRCCAVNNDRRCGALRHLRSRSTVLLHSRAPENTTAGHTRYRFGTRCCAVACHQRKEHNTVFILKKLETGICGDAMQLHQCQ